MKGYKVKITGEILEALCKVPTGVHVLKVTASAEPDYGFEVLFIDPKGAKVAEGADFPERG